ncbi:hypothetical protein GCM10010912_17550 [Paenibacillus albidus]|uniref:Major tropism determinant N-terminal domain-containing protein n=1 Tax=Paenibacillus albidus TaxID=2041023 RepID=A0A917C594_9BACL|nr:hypothetical protein [Paenibacillus albidus]GGF72823.1 hypothetical protein GCM10010912_17550 [Paenibacillus albidus]
MVVTTIQIKRGLSANLSTLTLEAGELALATDTGKLYAGNGTGRVLLNPDQAAAETAVKLQTPRTISITGDGTGSVSFDGSANAPITLVLANSGVTAGSYTKVTVDAKGRVTSASQMTAADIALGNVTNESKATMFTNAALTGNPTVPTQATADNSTRAASTAFVKAQGYLSASDTIDGGTF